MKLITLRYRGKALHFMAGPYIERVEGTVGVKLAIELDLPCDIDIPIIDYEVPTARDLEDGLIKIISVALAGNIPYIGCFGGIGRTGLVLASLFRCLSASEEDPVTWVRRVYLAKACEVKAQEELVRSFDVERVQNSLHLDPDGKVTLEEFLARIFARFQKTKALGIS